MTSLIRKTRGKPKPIRVFLQDGANDISFEDGILSYEFMAPRSLRWMAGSKDKGSKGAGSKRTLVTWLKVTGDSVAGALSGGTDSEIDLSIAGQRNGATPDADPEG